MKIQHLLESHDLIRNITDVIKKIRDQYVRSGAAVSYYEINNGLCDDFAEDVVNELGGYIKNTLFTISAEQFTLNGEGTEWDVKLLSEHWKSCRPTHGLEWKDIKHKIPSHVWVVFNNRHYDAECPDGVDNFFELPLLRRGMENISRQKVVRNENPTLT